MTSMGQCRILIVDDEMLIRQGIKHYIDWEQEGFLIVGEASNGQEALELIELTQPHVLITDIVMPIMDGEELTRIVKEKYPEIEIIILSSFGEFDYVRSTFQSGVVDYILKPKLDANGLLKVLKKAASRIASFQTRDKQVNQGASIDYFLDKLLSGYEVNFKSAGLENAFPYSDYCLLGVTGEETIQTTIKSDIDRALGQDLNQIEYYSFKHDQHTIVYLLNLTKNDITNVVKLANKLATKLQGVRFVLTEVFQELAHLGSIYKEQFSKLLMYQFYLPNRYILSDADLPELPHKFEKFNLDWFTGEMKRRHFDSAFNYLKEHVRTYSKWYTTDVFEYKAFFSNIIFNITILLSNMEYEVKKLENAKYSYFKAFDEVRTAEEAVVLLERFIEEANECLFAIDEHSENFNMKKLMEYIMDHYAEQLTLTEVAKHFHFNPSYLSNYFSTHNNEGFIEYLNKIRIEEATKLLIKNTESISEISGMVGYSDHSYFCKVFKKIKGVSPSQYRRKQTLR
ncbi:two-component system response regulator YesN [Bacillus sp. SLBN-46]|uniref:response regulator transcription factor n=1 Tax=Bacillus sp. SLBN-46 TaxID=3042283 RepID=UPI00285BABAE|nr:response regulator transcription factor [Bacillus sp. SLBN-46]MDR6120468.1 two-component system response regulator YesN [Bacillus sp. SLBN-46]